MQTVILPFSYFIFRRCRVNPQLIVFADSHHTAVPESMKTLLAAAKACPQLTVREEFADYQKESPLKTFWRSLRFMKLYAGAGCVVICDNFLPVSSCKKRKETMVIQLWHACGAFKKFGYDTTDDIPAYYKGNVFRNYDLVTVSGDSCVAPFTSAMRQPAGVVQALGIPRTDLLLDKIYAAKCRADFLRLYPKAKGRKIVLWAPTFRGNALDPITPGAEAIAELQEVLGDDWLVISKLHPHIKTEISGLFTVPELSADELLFSADLLISDYSSIIFDYALLQKPMLFWVPDFADYAEERGFYLDFHSLPGPVITDKQVLADAVRRPDFDPGAVSAFRQNYLTACDGGATQRVLDILQNKGR